MKFLKPLVGFGSVALASIALAASAFAYSGQVAGQVVVNGPDFVIACGYNWTVKAHVTESGTGNPIEGQPVHWEIVSQPSGASDTLTDTDTVTNASGNTSTKIHVTEGVYGTRTVRATADDVSTDFVLDCQADGLPPTSVASSADSLPVSSFNWAMLAAAGAVIAGFGILGLRFVRR